MNNSALWVFVFAVMSAYVHANIRCSDCNNPCSSEELGKVIKEFSQIMTVPHCIKNNHISYKANPKWDCIPSKPDMDMTSRPFRNAKCEPCEEAETKEILQDFKMLFRRSCPHNHTHYVLELKPVRVSLGCTCVKR